jgi:hypothetical protein
MSDENKGAGAGQENGKGSASGQENGQADGKGKSDGGKLTDSEAQLLKENMALKGELKKFKSAQEKAEADRLKESGQFKELHEKAQAKLAQRDQRLVQAELKALAVKEGIGDLDYLKLADVSGVTIDEDGNVTGAAEAISQLKASKPALFQAAPQIPGTPKPGSTGGQTGPATFDEYLKMPLEARAAFQAKHPSAYKALVDKAKGR